MNNRLIKNASWIIVCRIIQSLFSLIIGTLTARYLGPANYGLIHYASSIVAFVIPLMQLGFRNTLVYELVKKPDEEGRSLGTALLMNLISAALCIVGVVSFVFIANRGEPETILVCALYSLNLIFQALEMMQYWFQAKLLSQYTAVISVIAYVVVSAYRVYLLVSGKSIYWFAVSQALDYMIISVSLLIAYRVIGKSRLSFSALRGKEMLSSSRPYILSGMMVAVFGYIGSVFLKLLIGEQAVGFYTAAITCAGMANFVFTAIIDSARPVILESYRTDRDSFKHKMVQLYAVIVVLSVLESVVITVFAKWIVIILYGAAYSEAVLPLQIVTWQTVFSLIGTVRNIWILAEGKQQYLWWINAIGATLSISMNILLIPFAGPVGAAVSAVVTQLFANVVLSFVIKPIRGNNVLLLKSLNGKTWLAIFKAYIKHK